MESAVLKNMTKDELIVEIEQLRITEDRYRTLLDNSSDAIFSFDKDGQYLYVNKEFAKDVCGKQPEYIIGKKIWDIFSKEEADKRYALVKWVFENGKIRNIEVRVPNPNGDTYHLTTVKPILDEQNNVTSVICISKEITERIQVEKEREKLIKELQKALEDINTLSGLLPICAKCKKIRDDNGYWNSLEEYIEKHSDASFSHGMCSDCSDELYGKKDWYVQMKKNKKYQEKL
jgi:PAS domain S-box-containing protein